MAKHVQRVPPPTRTRHNCVSAPNCTDCEDDPADCPKLKRVKRLARQAAENSIKQGYPRRVWWVQIGNDYELRSEPLKKAA